jgi:hypothetical protein
MEDHDASPLRPSVPRHASAEYENDADDDEASRTQPQPFTPGGKDQLDELHGYKYDPNTLIAEGPEEIDPIHTPDAAISVLGQPYERGNGGLLNYALLRDGHGKAKQQHALPTFVPAPYALTDE